MRLSCGDRTLTRGRSINVMALAFFRVICCTVLLWGCIKPRLVERDSWATSAASLLRGEINFANDWVQTDDTAVSRFYLQRQDRPAWCGPTGPLSQVDALLDMLATAEDDGLRRQDYAYEHIRGEVAAWRDGRDKPDLLRLVRLDVLLTRAFLAYGGHLQRGRVDPRTIHGEWKAPVQAADLSGLLETALDLQHVGSALARLRPPQAGYNHLRDVLAKYRSLAASGGWPQLAPRIDASMVRRLTTMGDLPAEIKQPDRRQIAEAIAHFQQRHGLAADGRLDDLTLAELNRPVTERIAAIELNMERWRWLPHDPDTKYILVRIADYELDAVEGGKAVLSMRVIVGKPYWRTPIFSAELTHLVINPYWYIPPSIAVEEVLPRIKRDPDYLRRHDISVFAVTDMQSRSVDPVGIDWAKISSEGFDYSFAQAPGPDNPLGRLKFIFPNPYNVYLHDTPNSELFEKKKRAFSHGCIRLEKSADLAAYILRGQGNWPLRRIEQAIQSQINRQVVLVRPLPVYLLYWTAWVDEEGILQFRRDEYDSDQRLRQALIH